MLNLPYAILGILLTISAMTVVLVGQSVRDAQARLSLDAIVAEGFENPAPREDANDLNKLYAKRQGSASRKICVDQTRQRKQEVQVGPDRK